MTEPRWWGWGTQDATYDLKDRPLFWPFLTAALSLTGQERGEVVSLDSIALPECRLAEPTVDALRAALGADAVSVDSNERIRHAYGKSLRDLLRLRRGAVTNPPDAVVYPDAEERVQAVLELARRDGFTVVPFGGGTSVTGGVEGLGDRPVVTLDLRRLGRVLAVDAVSRTAVVQAGIFGPPLEAALNAQGFTLGHFPQSWEYSTLGGWIATRSAGQQSTGYGKIEAMVLSLRVVTPAGIIQTRTVPASAAGPLLKELLAGSEGTFGVITQATVRLQPLPPRRDYRGVVFRTFPEGVDAVREIMQAGAHPVSLRLSDPAETHALLAMQRRHSGFAGWKDAAGKWLLRRQGYELAARKPPRPAGAGGACLLILGCEGQAGAVAAERDRCLSICRRHGGFHLGTGVGRQWYGERFALPYLRDVLLDHGVLTDTLETATVWSNLTGLHVQVSCALRDALTNGYVMCHVSHSYAAGASLYFTFLARGEPGREIEQWLAAKGAATECIMANGGTLSHHHGVGYEHAPWLALEDGSLGVEVLRAAKLALDPSGLMNPGKLVLPCARPGMGGQTEE